MKSRFQQLQIKEQDRFKIAFIVPFGHYEWHVMPFGLKNASSEFQNIMNDIFNSLLYILMMFQYFSDLLQKHVVHLKKFFKLIKANGMSYSTPKMKLFQTKISFLGHEIY